ncbi:MAG: STAS domain-containing protein [Solirubrobacterales bacterium]|nr:STAS domain-containing protein [Solirubrobacterales bacterium]
MFAEPRFEVEVEVDEQATTMVVHGEIDIGTAGRLKLVRDSLLDDAPRKLVIDLRSTSFVDSNGLRFLLDTYRLALAGGWTLELLKPSEQVMRVFEITGADQQLPFVE